MANIMIWQKSLLTLQSDLSNVTCSTVSVSPWTFGAGQKTPAGTFLSPENAVNILKNKIAMASADHKIVIFMQSAEKLENLIGQITLLNNILPIPQVQSTLRKAQSMLTLFEERMKIPRFGVGLPPFQKLAAESLRSIENNQTINQAINSAKSAVSASGLMSEISNFKSQKEALKQQLSNKLNNYLNIADKTIVNSIAGTRDVLLNEITKNIPNADHIYTSAIMFISNDISQIERMIKHVNE